MLAGCAQTPLRGSRVPSVTGRGFPRFLAEALRVSLPPAGQRGERGPYEVEKTTPPNLPSLPARSQPEVEHGAGVHQQRPKEETRENPSDTAGRDRTGPPPPLHPGPLPRYPQSSRSPIMAAASAAEAEKAGTARTGCGACAPSGHRVRRRRRRRRWGGGGEATVAGPCPGGGGGRTNRPVGLSCAGHASSRRRHSSVRGQAAPRDVPLEAGPGRTAEGGREGGRAAVPAAAAPWR